MPSPSSPRRAARSYEALVASVLLTQRRRRRFGRTEPEPPDLPGRKLVPAPDPLTTPVEPAAPAPVAPPQSTG